MTEPNLRSYLERPTIYVFLGGGVPEAAYHWVEVGAEEEGVPCRLTAETGQDAAALAYEAARQSRLGVGVGVTRDRVALHEAHMPPDRPVLVSDVGGDAMPACRLIGSNAGRMVKRMPLRLATEPAAAAVRSPARRRAGSGEEPGSRSPRGGFDGGHQVADDLRQTRPAMDAGALAATIARVLSARGVK